MSLEQTRADWDRLGRSDPLWAVLVDPAAKNGNWDLQAFFATGVAEVGQALTTLRQLAGDTGSEVALDFGCGVGRLTQALAAHYKEVIGVDISAEMLSHARAFDTSGGRARFLLNTEPHLAQIPDGSVDLVYSSLVLQHIPPAAARVYLREFTRIVRPGGAIAVQVPTRIRMTAKGMISAFAPFPVQRWAQRKFLGYPAPMRMHTFSSAAIGRLFAANSVELVGTVCEPDLSPHWIVTRFYAVRRNSTELI